MALFYWRPLQCVARSSWTTQNKKMARRKWNAGLSCRKWWLLLVVCSVAVSIVDGRPNSSGQSSTEDERTTRAHPFKQRPVNRRSASTPDVLRQHLKQVSPVDQSPGLSTLIWLSIHWIFVDHWTIRHRQIWFVTFQLTKSFRSPQALSKCNSREPPPTQKVLLKDKNAVCNDGSPAGYYVRKSYGSKRWIVYLEGGWYCYDKSSCDARWTRLRGFMTSNMWPDTRQGNFLDLI